MLLPCVLSADDQRTICAGDPTSCKALSVVTSSSEVTTICPSSVLKMLLICCGLSSHLFSHMCTKLCGNRSNHCFQLLLVLLIYFLSLLCQQLINLLLVLLLFGLKCIFNHGKTYCWGRSILGPRLGRCVICMDVTPHRQNVLTHTPNPTHIFRIIAVSLCICVVQCPADRPLGPLYQFCWVKIC